MNKHILSMFKSKKVAAAVLATLMAGSYSYSTFAAEPEVDEQGRTVHHVQIIEDENWGYDQNDYWKNNGIRHKRAKEYNFTSDTLISVDANDEKAYDTCEWSRVVRGIAWAGDVDGTINMNGHRLDIKVFGPHEYNIFGMQVSSGGLTIDNVKGMDILVKDASNANGLVVVGTANCGAWYNGDGSPRLTINNADGMENAVKIRFEDCFAGGNHAIEVDGGSGRADLTIKGLVDAETQGMYNKGLRATDGTLEISHTNIGGGRIVSHDSNSIYSFGGEVNINAELTEDGSISVPHADNPVVLYGNIRVDGARTVDSNVTVGLNNAESRLDGTVQVVNQFGHTGHVNLALANGAVWNNEWLDKDDNAKGRWGGTYVNNFQGGTDAEHAGVILQKAEKNLNIATYSGNTMVIYEHTDNGTKAEHYKAGNVVINNAKAEASITLSTDNTGIDLENSAEVNKVLSTLAGKLYYMSSDKNANLEGKVQIADGLTGSSKALQVGDITFGADHKGQYSADGVVIGDYNFTETLTAKYGKDEQYAEAGVVFDDGLRYEFNEGSTVSIDVTNGRGAIALGGETEGMVINAKEGKLLLNNKGTSLGETITGFSKASRGGATINAGDIVVKVDNTDFGRADAIHVEYASSGEAAKTTINGNLAVNSYGNGHTLGVYTAGNAELEINGDVTMRGEGGKYGVDNFGTGDLNHYSISGLYAGANYSIQKGAKLVVNGNTDLYINGSGVVANGGGSYIELNGDTNIEIAKNEEQRHFAVEAESATVNINMNEDKDAAADHKVTINGNIGSTAGSVNENEANKHSEINLGIANNKSVLHGVVINEFEGSEDPTLEGSSADINLYLSNGGLWINEAWGNTDNGPYEFAGSVVSNFVGGDAAHTGVILQKDANDLTIKNYSGNTVVVYEHAGEGKNAEDYAGGKTIVQNAAEGSGIIISTDSHDINLDEYSHIDAVMNNLAGKIVYEGYVNGEKNLQGKVQIADGLTSSSKGIEISDITFNEETGEGIYTPAPDRKPRQKVTDFWVPIFGRGMGNGDEMPFQEANVKVGDSEYLFQKDTSLHGNKYSGAAIKVLGEKTKIDASGVNLTISGNYAGRFAGIIVGAKPEKNLDLTAKNLIINVGSTDNVAAGIQSGDPESNIFVKDNVMNVKGNVLIKGVNSQKDAAYGIQNVGSTIKIDGDLIMKSESGSWAITGNNDKGVAGIVVGENGTSWGDMGGSVTVTGNTELVVHGDAIVTQNEKATVDLKRGVKIKVAKDDEQEFYAIRATEGTVNITESEGMLTFPVPQPTSGDLIEIYGNVEAIDGTVNLAMKSLLSVFNGVVTGENFNLELINGANWLNSSYGNASFDFEGSYVNNFKGSQNPAFAGVIVQSDSNDLTINNFSGNTIVMYEHTKDGTLDEHYKGGNTIINNAKEGSGIIVATSNTGIDMSDEATVTKVLNTLAGKLYYMSSTENTNLSGKVQISDGLTSSSKALQVGDIKFNEEHQGQYVEGSMNPGITEPEQKDDYNFTEALTAAYGKDKQYEAAGVIDEDGNYNFEAGRPVIITVEDARGAISLGKDTDGIEINAKDTSIILNNSSKVLGTTITGYARSVKGEATLNVGDLVANVDNTKNGRAEGIHVDYANAGDAAKTTINGNISTNVKGEGYALGIYTSGNAELEINGNVTMRGKDGDFGVDNFGSGPDHHYNVSGIYAGSNYTIQKGSKVVVNGDTDLYINGTGILANGGGSYIELNGDTNIEIAKNDGQRHFAVAAESGTANVNMNEDKTAAAGNKVTLKGNIGSTVGSVHENEFHKETLINIGMSTSDSVLQGVIINEKASGVEPPFAEEAGNSTDDFTFDINLYLSNGATWINEVWGTADKGAYEFEGSIAGKVVGGATAEQAGVIVQKDDYDLTIENYSGHNYLIYEHTDNGTEADHYAAGNTIIDKAAVGSGIVVMTDSTGIAMDNRDEVTQVLNTLAGKLYYMSSDKDTNLAGKVQIADGLTSSSKALQVGDIEFKEDHQGKLEADSMTPGFPHDGGAEPDLGFNFTEALTAAYGKDKQYEAAGVITSEGDYEFTGTKPVTITVENERGAISLGKDTEGMAINAKEASLILNNSGSEVGNTITGYARSVRGEVTLNVKDLIANINNKGNGRAEGIHVDYASGGKAAKTTINGNVSTNVKGNEYALGIYTSGNAELEINGNVTMRGEDGDFGVDNFGTGPVAHYNVSGIYAGSNYTIQKGSRVVVNGDTDLYINGTGILANGGGSYIELNGDTNIEIAKNDGQRHFAVAAESGTANVNMNKEKTAAAGNKVTIKGNIGSTVGSVHENEFHKETLINVGMSTSDSVLHGAIVNEYASGVQPTPQSLVEEENSYDDFTFDINLYLSNGATWINELWGTADSGPNEFAGSIASKVVGGADKAHAGVIVQKDEYDLTINDYSGHNYLIYEHTANGTKAEHYAAGNTIIDKAAAGSGITVMTDNSGIAMDNKDEVTQVLNTLAGKLYYMNSANDTNLAGKVQIADGLTSSSAALQVGDIEFKEDHQGQLKAGSMTPGFGGGEVQPPVEEGYTAGLNLGGYSGNDQYVKDGVTKDNHSVSFAGTNTIAVTDSTAINYGQEVDHNKEVVVNTGDKLILNVNGVKDLVGISNAVNSDMKSAQMKVTGKKLELNVTNSNEEGGNAVGILQKGTKDTTITADTAIKVEATNKAHGIEANAGKQGRVNLNGNTAISVNKDAREGYAIYVNGVEDNLVNINYNYDYEFDFTLNNYEGGNRIDADEIMSTKKTVKIDGDVFMASKGGQQSAVSIGLAGKDSYWNGVADADTGVVNLAVMNGATWNNEVYNAAPVMTMDGKGFAGSNIAHFTGGADAAHAGVILQKDTHDITIDRYTGNTKVVYEHTGNGTSADHYAAGNIKINNADAGAGITLITDNSGIVMDNAEEVTEVLNTLANKLFYMSSDKDANLAGKVQIADGLTSSSKALQVGDIEFKEDHQGQFKEGSMTPGFEGGSAPDPEKPDPEKPNPEKPEVEDGDYETTIMQGIRNIAMTNMSMWRDNAADMGYRASELRNGAEDGIWARTYGGKAKYDANKDKFDTSYWGVQVGYDAKADDNWNVGVAFNYVDGDGSYIMGGDSDNSLYSFGAYATKAASNGSYIDLAAKIGSVNGDYTVYNQIATTDFSSEYKAMAYSLSAEYGKRFGDEEKGYFEPQIQLTYAHVDSDDYTGYSKKADQYMNINQEAFDSLVGRIGIEAGRETAKGGFYGRLSVAHEFAGDVDATYLAAGDKEAKSTSFDMGDTWSELTLGGHYQMSANSSFYIDFTKSLSGDYQQDWKVNGGLRFTF